MLMLKEVTRHYTALCSQIPLKPIRSAQEHEQAVAALNNLMDAGVANEDHPLADLLVILGELISVYEDKHLLHEQASPAGVLRFLMDQHGLAQADLPEVGSQGVVSEVLSGKRVLNVRQVRALAERFGSPLRCFLIEPRSKRI